MPAGQKIIEDAMRRQVIKTYAQLMKRYKNITYAKSIPEKTVDRIVCTIMSVNADIEVFMRAQFESLGYVKFFNPNMICSPAAIERYEKWLTHNASKYRFEDEAVRAINSNKSLDQPAEIKKKILRDHNYVSLVRGSMITDINGDKDFLTMVIVSSCLSSEYLAFNKQYERLCEEGIEEHRQEVLKIRRSEYLSSIVKKEMIRLGYDLLIL